MEVAKSYKKSKKGHYEVVNGKRLIQIQVKSPLQLFDSRDPAPFRERDLDDDFAEYLISCAEEFSDRESLQILILIQGLATEELNKDEIAKAVNAHFLYQIELKRIQLAKVFRRARTFCLIGGLILVISLTLSRLVEHVIPQEGFRIVLKEGLIIFGWVSLWRPLEVLLFDWYPHYESIRLFKKINAAEIEVQFGVQVKS